MKSLWILVVAVVLGSGCFSTSKRGRGTNINTEEDPEAAPWERAGGGGGGGGPATPNP